MNVAFLKNYITFRRRNVNKMFALVFIISKGKNNVKYTGKSGEIKLPCNYPFIKMASISELISGTL